MKNILIICTGNTCRSPLIAAILQNNASKSAQYCEFSFTSAGISTVNGDQASLNSISVANKLNIDISGHKTRQLTQKIIDDTDIILCVTQNHKLQILDNFKDVSYKCFSISECLDQEYDISDPYGQTVDVYQQLANQIISIAPKILAFLKKIFAKAKISIGCDHNGYQLAMQIIKHFNKKEFIQHCPQSTEQHVDYPDHAFAVAQDVYDGSADFGILICKSGVGMSIAANKHIGIRAALCHNKHIAELSRLHNDANILCIGAEYTNIQTAIDMVEILLTTKFQGERHTRRLEKIANFEKKQYNIVNGFKQKNIF